MASSSSDESDGPEEQQYKHPGKYVSAPTAESSAESDDDDNEADNQSTASSSSEKEPNNPENVQQYN